MVAAFDWHRSSADAAFPLALSLDEAHLPPSLVPPSGSAAVTDTTRASTLVSSAAASPVVAHAPFACVSAFENAVAKLVSALARHAASTGFSFCAAFASQATLAAAFLPTAFNLAERHLAAGGVFAIAGVPARPMTAMPMKDTNRECAMAPR